VKNAFGYDDALDVFGVHCIGGIIGALGTGSWSTPPSVESASPTTPTLPEHAGTYDFVTQMIAQARAVGATCSIRALVRRFSTSVDVVIGLRPSVEAEREGLDITITANAPTIVILPGRDLRAAPRTTVRAHTRQCTDRRGGSSASWGPFFLFCRYAAAEVRCRDAAGIPALEQNRRWRDG